MSGGSLVETVAWPLNLPVDKRVRNGFEYLDEGKLVRHGIHVLRRPCQEASVGGEGAGHCGEEDEASLLQGDVDDGGPLPGE
eukprot:16417228-Heterocapsa_arctica.AAC.1